MAEMLVVKSKLKEVVGDCNIAGDFAEALSAEVENMVVKASERAVANGRKTIQKRDL